MVARRESELAVARARIVSELEDIGFAGVERRVQTMAGMDVSNLDSLKAAVDATIKASGGSTTSSTTPVLRARKRWSST